VRNTLAKRDFGQFRLAALPRAFAVSANGAHWAWSANDPNSIDVALARCKARGGGQTTGTDACCTPSTSALCTRAQPRTERHAEVA
jgi:hypothetical protein